jgi:AraC family transcriptional regulator
MATTPRTSAADHTLPGSTLRRVTEHIQAHLDQDLTLAHLGAVVYMSPYHFARRFQHSTGLPPHRFVVHARIDHAATLLAAPDLSISQISRVVGFRSPSHFATVFHRIKGVTPSEYRARQGLDAEARRGAVAGPVAQEGGRDGLQ